MNGGLNLTYAYTNHVLYERNSDLLSKEERKDMEVNNLRSVSSYTIDVTHWLVSLLTVVI
jgi:hypothetical protein